MKVTKTFGRALAGLIVAVQVALCAAYVRTGAPENRTSVASNPLTSAALQSGVSSRANSGGGLTSTSASPEEASQAAVSRLLEDVGQPLFDAQHSSGFPVPRFSGHGPSTPDTAEASSFWTSKQSADNVRSFLMAHEFAGLTGGRGLTTEKINGRTTHQLRYSPSRDEPGSVDTALTIT